MPESESGPTRSFEESRAGNREAEKREKALRDIIDRGRAKTPEEAERYLEAVVGLKERVISLLREFLLEQIEKNRTRTHTPVDLPDVVERQESDDSWQDVRAPVAILQSKDLDRSDARLWSLNFHLETGFQGDLTGEGDWLILPMKDRVIGVYPSDAYRGNPAGRLKDRLSPEELQLLTNEYDLSYQDLAERLKARAKDLKDGLFKPRDSRWGPLFESRKKTPRK